MNPQSIDSRGLNLVMSKRPSMNGINSVRSKDSVATGQEVDADADQNGGNSPKLFGMRLGVKRLSSKKLSELLRRKSSDGQSPRHPRVSEISNSFCTTPTRKGSSRAAVVDNSDVRCNNDGTVRAEGAPKVDPVVSPKLNQLPIVESGDDNLYGTSLLNDKANVETEGPESSARKKRDVILSIDIDVVENTGTEMVGPTIKIHDISPPGTPNCEMTGMLIVPSSDNRSLPERITTPITRVSSRNILKFKSSLKRKEIKWKVRKMMELFFWWSSLQVVFTLLAAPNLGHVSTFGPWAQVCM